MKTTKIVLLTSVCFAAVAVAVASAQKGPAAKPEKIDTIVQALAAQLAQLSTFVTGLATQVAGVETSVAGIQTAVTELQTNRVTRTVFRGSIDLNGPGDVVRDEVWTDNIRRVRHFARFPVAGLMADDPPVINLYQRRRTDASPPFATTTGFILSNAMAIPSSTLGGFSVFLDPTFIVVEDGQILVQFKAELFNPSTLPAPNTVRYGLDGPGGTGDYRLVVVR